MNNLGQLNLRKCLIIYPLRIIAGILNMLPKFFKAYISFCYHANSMFSCLDSLRKKGFSPKIIIDCGAYKGDWTRIAKMIFPDAYVFMIEAQADMEKYLMQVRFDYPSNVDYVISLLGAEDKDAVRFFNMGAGSSVYGELTDMPRKAISLPMRTLDSVLGQKNIRGSVFLKIDVQGYELEVLKGARDLMKYVDVILLEVSLIGYNRHAPLFDEVMKFMREYEFMLYDICGLERWKDKTLFQMDVFFVNKDNALRGIKFR